MIHPFAGFSGVISAVSLGSILWAFCRKSKKAKFYNVGSAGDAKAFEPILARYVRLMEFMIGLAAGSIVLIVGSSALHQQSGHLPWFYASPLILLASAVIYGIGFMAAELLTLESNLHEKGYSASSYATE